MFKVIIWPLLFIVGVAYYDFIFPIRSCHPGLIDIASCDQERLIFFSLIILALLLYILVSFVWIRSSRNLSGINAWWFLAVLAASIILVYYAYNFIPFFTLGYGFGTIILVAFFKNLLL